MPLILAIEPDRRQATELAAIVRGSLKAELIVAETTERALDAIGDRVPDLVLVPALLSPKDDAALAAALRVIAAAAHVQTLTIPVFASRAPRLARGVLSTWRRRRAGSRVPDGCDPAVFAGQIAAYLVKDDAAAPFEPSAIEPAAIIIEAPAFETVASDLSIVAASPGETSAQDDSTTEDTEDTEKQSRLEQVLTSESSVSTVVESFILERPFTPVIDDELIIVAQPLEETAELTVDLSMELAALVVTYPPLPRRAARTAIVEELPAPSRLAPERLSPKVELGTLELWMPLAVGATWPALEGQRAEPPPVSAPAVAQPDVAAPAPSREAERPEWLALLESLRHDVERLRADRLPSPSPNLAGAAPQGCATEEGATVPVAQAFRACEEITPPNAQTTQNDEGFFSADSASSAVDHNDVLKPRVEDRPDVAARRPKQRPKQPKPVQDEWGFFDPEQCGFAALLAKLEEITNARDGVVDALDEGGTDLAQPADIVREAHGNT